MSLIEQWETLLGKFKEKTCKEQALESLNDWAAWQGGKLSRQIVPRIPGAYLTEKIKTLYKQKDFLALAETFPNLTIADMYAIVTDSKYIDGDSSSGYTIKEYPKKSGDHM